MLLYNTLTREKERFKPLSQEKVKVYYCGPTPYNFAHIGNLRAYLFEDFLIRTLRYLGYKVETVMNVTDIDDKTIRDSQKAGIDLTSYTKKYTEYFLADLARLKIDYADHIVPISSLIDEMVTMINGLLKKDYAYLAEDGSIYYSIKKFKKYGELAHLDIKGMKTSVRINNDEYDKESAADFALWKAYDSEADGPNKWEATFIVDGKEVTLPGRPGWHIECSACNLKYFGTQIDIHMGGIDNIFPHHQNEIAQSEAYTGKKFANYWLHGGHLLVDNKKMAKSAGNFYTLADIVKWTSNTKEELIYRGFRLMALQTKYRESFNFTFDRLQAAITTVKGLDEVLKRIKHYEAPEKTPKSNFREDMQMYVQAYVAALEDDLSTPDALVVVFDLMTYINAGIDKKSFSKTDVSGIINLIQSMDQVLSVFDFTILETEEEIPEELMKLLADRNDAKAQKNYELADKIRAEIGERGYKIIDAKEGARLEKI